MQGEPLLCFGASAEDADRAKILLGHNCEYSHHAKDGISASDDRACAEPNFLSNSPYLSAHGPELVALRQRSHLMNVQQDVQMVWAAGSRSNSRK